MAKKVRKFTELFSQLKGEIKWRHYCALEADNPCNDNHVKTSKKSILVADDDNDLLIVVKMQLQQAGFEVALSPNARGIAGMVTRYQPDVILLDISMDGISGEDVCKKLKADRATAAIPVIMFSADDNIEAIVSACGANDFVRKPFNVQTMQEKIEHVLHEH